MIDGLGFEEVNQSGLSTNLVQTVSGIHTRTVATNVIGTTDVSGLNIFAQGSGLFGRVRNADGAIFPSSTGSAATYGAFAQAGTVATGAGSGGTIEFGRQFNSTTSYFVVLTAGSATAAGAFVSGTKNVSGCEVVGGASTTYNYIALGT